MSPCEIVFFDAGGTLLHPEPSVGEAYARAGRRHGIEVAAEAIGAAFFREFRARKRESLPRGESWWRDVVVRSFAPFGTPRDPDGLFDELYGSPK